MVAYCVCLQAELVELAKEESLNKKSMASSCAAIRRVVPWQTLERGLISNL